MSVSCTFLSMWGSQGSSTGEFKKTIGIAGDNAGNIDVADSVNSHVQIFSITSTFLRSWNSNGTSNGAFVHPQVIAINGTGYLYVVDQGNQRIGIFRNDGAFTKFFRLGPPGNFTMAMGIAIDSQGFVYVDDANTSFKDGFSGNVTKFTQNGALVSSWGGVNSGGPLFYPQSLALDRSCNV